MILLVLATGGTLVRSTKWLAEPTLATYTFSAFAGLALAVVVEGWGLPSGLWAYQAHMSRVPGTALWAVPLAQLLILTPLSLLLCGVAGRRAGAEIE